MLLKVPALRGVIRRRILVNFRVDPAVMRRHLPNRFAPKLHAGSAVAGICLIRLERIRPWFVPLPVGLSSENAANRVAVRWEEDGPREGVFIPRRDTGSLLNSLAGGRLFPGEHQRASFSVEDADGRIDFSMRSADGTVALDLKGRVADRLPAASRFSSLEEASNFFKGGSVGYSVTAEPGRLEGIALDTKTWEISPLAVEAVRSSWFDDPERFPPGSVAFDCALLMRGIEHEWRGLPDLYSDPA